MRKLNVIIAHIMLILTAAHVVLGIMNLTGVGSVISRGLTHTLIALIAVHALIGIVLTIQTLKARARSDAYYPKQNRKLQIRRLSGFALMILVVFHITAFSGVSRDHYVLPEFNLFRLITQILMALSLLIHLTSNFKPLFIASGVRKFKVRAADLIFWFSVILVLSIIAFIIYYIRWISL